MGGRRLTEGRYGGEAVNRGAVWGGAVIPKVWSASGPVPNEPVLP